MVDSRTVLIADDDVDMQFLLGLYAGQAGYAVASEVGDGRAALDEWRRLRDEGTPLDALVLDQMMPQHTGLDVATQIRAEDLDVTLVLISAAMSSGLASAARAIGVDHALSKTDLRNLTAVLSD